MVTADEDELRPTSAETRAWVQALTAKWPPAPALVETPDYSKLYLLAWPFIVTYWFWAPWLFTKVGDLTVWLISHAVSGNVGF